MIVSIRYKLFFVIILACTSVVIGMFLLMQWSFDRGFLNYVNKTEVNLFEKVQRSATQSFEQQRSWQFIIDDHRNWHRLIRAALPERDDLPPEPPIFARQNNIDNERGARRRKPEPREFRRPPPFDRHPPAEPMDLNDEKNEGNEVSKGTERPERKTRPRNKQAEATFQPKEFHRRLTLFDANKVRIIGGPLEFSQQTIRAIKFQDKIVGYLGIEPLKELLNANELQFSEQQTDTFAFIALASILLAGVLAFPLANHLVKPIKRLKQSTRILTSGHYDARVLQQGNDELGELSRDFNILAETLENNEQARQRWIADISHELRTPLSVLRGEIEAIIDGVRDADVKSISSLHQEVMQLTRLVADLYELSLSDLGALDYKKSVLDLNSIASSALDNFSAQFKDKKIELNLKFNPARPIDIHCDRERIHQLFSNLLRNSLRYTDQGGIVEVTLKRKSDWAILNIQDSAPGVSDEDLPHLFNRLYRVESSRNRALGGAGLGLAIVKNIVEAHQGKIEAQCSALGGLSITIQLPLNTLS